MDPNHPTLHYQLIQLAMIDLSEVDETIRSVFEEERKKLTNSATPEEINNEYGKKNTNYLSRIARARASITINPKDKQTVKEQFLEIDENATREECECVLQLISKYYSKEDIDLFKSKAHKLFPYASAFE